MLQANGGTDFRVRENGVAVRAGSWHKARNV